VYLFEERGNDAIQATPRDLLEVSVGPMTRFKAKRFRLSIDFFETYGLRWTSRRY
jgi:hypothetical protein